MTEIIWGETPKKRQRKEEKYSTPVVTLCAIEKVGAGRKISFNKAAQELLGIQGEDKILFGFTAEGNRVFLKKSFIEKSVKLTQTCTLSDKKTYESIVKCFNFNIEQENELDILPVEGQGYFELSPISDLTKTISESQKVSENLEFQTTDLGVVEEVEENATEIQNTLSPIVEEGEKVIPLYERIHGKKNPIYEAGIDPISSVEESELISEGEDSSTDLEEESEVEEEDAW